MDPEQMLKNIKSSIEQYEEGAIEAHESLNYIVIQLFPYLQNPVLDQPIEE